MNENKQTKTVKMYEKLWDDFDNDFVEQATKDLEMRFIRNRLSFTMLTNKLVLDMGCGSGRNSVALKRLGAREVIGIDLNDTERFKYPNVVYKKGNVLEMPYKDNMFDFVFCNGVLLHTTDPNKGIKEIYRVLKPGGKAWLYVVGECQFWKDVERIRTKIDDYDRESLIKILKISDFPVNKTFFILDIFGVPIMKYYKKDELERLFIKIGFKDYQYLERGLDYNMSEKQYRKVSGFEYGFNGDLRYILTK